MTNKNKPELIARIRLANSERVNSSAFDKMLSETKGSALKAIDALCGIAKSAGVVGYEPCSLADATAIYDKQKAVGFTPEFWNYENLRKHFGNGKGVRGVAPSDEKIETRVAV